MRILCLIVSLFVVNLSFATEQPEADFPKIELKNTPTPPSSKLVFNQNFKNFGEVDFGEKYIYQFQFTNQGNTTLYLEEAFAANENSEVYSYSPEVKVGETGWVRVSFESAFTFGKFSEFFFVRSNSQGKKTLSRLEIKYELFEYLAIGGDNVEESDKVNIRERPLLNSPIVCQLSKGESCKILADDIGDYVDKFDDSFWFKIESEGKVGWVLSALTEF